MLGAVHCRGPAVSARLLVCAAGAGMPTSTGAELSVKAVRQLLALRRRRIQTAPASAATATIARAGIQIAPASDTMDRPPKNVRIGPAQHTAQAPMAAAPVATVVHGFGRCLGSVT